VLDSDSRQAARIAIMSSAGEGGVENKPELAAIREVLSGTILRVSQYSDNGIFSDIDSFVKLSQGNATITEVNFIHSTRKEMMFYGKRSSQSQVA
jgi:hypothetical protein